MKTRPNLQQLTIEELIDELRALAGEAATTLGNAGAEHAHATVAALRERYEAARDRLTELSADARQRIIAGAQYTDRTIREHPYQSLAIALGVGVLVGALACSRGRRDE